MANVPRKTGLSRPGSSGRPALPSLVPEEDDGGSPDDPWKESTPIMDMVGLYKKVGQTAAMMKTLVQTVPQLEGKVGLAVDAARNAQREAFDAKTAATLAQGAATLAQQRVEDVCKRVENLEPVKAAEAATQVKVNGLNERIEEGVGKRRWLHGIIITLLISLLASAAGAIWWASQVDASVRHEQAQRDTADRTLDAKVAERPTRDEVLTRNELKELRDELVKNREPSVADWFSDLPPDKQRGLLRVLGNAPGQATSEKAPH